MLQLSKRWTIAGVVLAVGGFFLHPEACIHGSDLIGRLVPLNDQDIIAHLSLVVGGVITALGNGLAHKEPK